MEIEGVINHVTKSLEIRRESLEKELFLCKMDLLKWTNIRQIHADQELQAIIGSIDNIRQIIGDEKYTKLYFSNEPEDDFRLLGYLLDHIQFYIDLRKGLRGQE